MSCAGSTGTSTAACTSWWSRSASRTAASRLPLLVDVSRSMRMGRAQQVAAAACRGSQRRSTAIALAARRPGGRARAGRRSGRTTDRPARWTAAAPRAAARELERLPHAARHRPRGSRWRGYARGRRPRTDVGGPHQRRPTCHPTSSAVRCVHSRRARAPACLLHVVAPRRAARRELRGARRAARRRERPLVRDRGSTSRPAARVRRALRGVQRVGPRHLPQSEAWSYVQVRSDADPLDAPARARTTKAALIVV